MYSIAYMQVTVVVYRKSFIRISNVDGFNPTAPCPRSKTTLSFGKLMLCKLVFRPAPVKNENYFRLGKRLFQFLNQKLSSRHISLHCRIGDGYRPHSASGRFRQQLRNIGLVKIVPSGTPCEYCCSEAVRFQNSFCQQITTA